MALRTVIYTDPEGRKWRKLLPDTVGDELAYMGVPAGPPPLDDLGLPLDLEIRLHNELFARGLFEFVDARRKHAEIAAALNTALRVDVQRIIALYQG